MEWLDLVKSQVKWFDYLVPSDKHHRNLLSTCSEKDIYFGLLICGIMADDRLKFALFPNYMSFTNFHFKLLEERRCFFEIIPGDYPQKPHFDIDVSLEKYPDFNDIFLSDFIDVVIATFKDLYRKQIKPASDLLIFTSHGPKKRSFHLVIDNYCHANNREAKFFCQEVIKRLPNHLSCHLDQTVYSKMQQFRVVGSQKKSSGRIKQLLSPWLYQQKEIVYEFKETPVNEVHRFNLLLEASLVSQTCSCQMLPLLIPADEKIGYQPTSDSLPNEIIAGAMKLLDNKIKETSRNGSIPFQFRDVANNLILLKRLYPSYCQICHRIHEHENPYLILIRDENKNHHVYFDCRRSDNQRLYLGTLNFSACHHSYNPKSLDKPGKYITPWNDVISKINETATISMKECRRKRREITSH